MNAQTFVDRLTATVAPLQQRLCLLYWELATTGKPEVAEQLAKTEKELARIFSNRTEFQQVKQWQADGITDPLLSRQIDLLVNDYLPNQLDEKTLADLIDRQTAIENIFNNFRSELEGKKVSNNDLKGLLKTETDNQQRRKVWEAGKQIGPEVAEKIKELVRRKNAAARSLGFPNHFEMSLHLQELNSHWLFELFAQLKQATQATFENKIEKLHAKLAARYGITPAQIRPWHYEDFFCQELPSHGSVDMDPLFKNADILEICREHFDGIGLDIADVLGRSDLFEKEGKSQHAFCLCVDKKLDIRVLANIRPNKYWMRTMLHELGHAAYDKYIDQSLPHLLRDSAHILTTEAMALWVEQMTYHPHWLTLMGILPAAETKKRGAEFLETLSLGKLISIRWMMMLTTFERALYTDPGQDLTGLWWKLVKEYQLMEKPEGRNAPDWATKIHIATAPVYYQNYLLGELFAAQIATTLEKEATGKPFKELSFSQNPKVGKILKERLFAMGMKLPWHQLVPHVTGHELGAAGFVKQFC